MATGNCTRCGEQDCEFPSMPDKDRWFHHDFDDKDAKFWDFLEHRGPLFAPPYTPLPSGVQFCYDGKPMQLSLETEEMASFYAKILDAAYVNIDVFNNNFFGDWKNVMTDDERAVITELERCDFTQLAAHYKDMAERRRNRTTDERQKLREREDEIQAEYGFCDVDGQRVKTSNYRVEPPGLFRSRGNHPSLGKLKARVLPEDVIINCSRDARVPEPPEGHRWKEVQHDSSVTWLAKWVCNVMDNPKYMMLNLTPQQRGGKDCMRYETARQLTHCVDRIRAQYNEDLTYPELLIRQRAVAMYFIDKLSLSIGCHKDEGPVKRTVGCCTLRVKHFKLHEELLGETHVVEFDFHDEDSNSIPYQNKVTVGALVFKTLQDFLERKGEDDFLFDQLSPSLLNTHLQSLMDGLTARVFRIYNASKTFQEQLDLLTVADDPTPSKLLAYKEARQQAAHYCRHEFAAPIRQCDQKVKALETFNLKYLDPRISIAWCKKWGVPRDAVYDRPLPDNCLWALDMADAGFRF